MPIDYKRYPANWKTEIVPAVLSRADNCCEQCGLKNKQIVFGVKLWVRSDTGRYKLRAIWFSNNADALRECRDNDIAVRKIKVVLTVAHLDHDETNHDVKLERLKALCQSCHLRYDSKEKFRRETEKWKQKAGEREKAIISGLHAL